MISDQSLLLSTIILDDMPSVLNHNCLDKWLKISLNVKQAGIAMYTISFIAMKLAMVANTFMAVCCKLELAAVYS